MSLKGAVFRSGHCAQGVMCRAHESSKVNKIGRVSRKRCGLHYYRPASTDRQLHNQASEGQARGSGMAKTNGVCADWRYASLESRGNRGIVPAP